MLRAIWRIGGRKKLGWYKFFNHKLGKDVTKFWNVMMFQPPILWAYRLCGVSVQRFLSAGTQWSMCWWRVDCFRKYRWSSWTEGYDVPRFSCFKFWCSKFQASYYAFIEHGKKDKRSFKPALPLLESYNDKQLFFMSFASFWCGHSTKESLRSLLFRLLIKWCYKFIPSKIDVTNVKQ